MMRRRRMRRCLFTSELAKASPTRLRVAPSHDRLRVRGGLSAYPPDLTGLDLALSFRLRLLTPRGASHGGDGDGVNKVPPNKWAPQS